MGAYCKRGKGLIKVNGRPLELVQPEALSFKLQEPILLLGKDRFADIDIRIRVKGGGHTSQVYAIRQALSKSLVAYYQKYVDEQSKQERAQEVWRSGSTRQIPEVLPLKDGKIYPNAASSPFVFCGLLNYGSLGCDVSV